MTEGEWLECTDPVLMLDLVSDNTSDRKLQLFVDKMPMLITESVLAASSPTLIRDIFGNPFRPVTIDPRWLTSSVVDLASAIYGEKAFDRMPILGDALMDAGCDNEEIIAHCRSEGPHVRGCWVVDLLLGKE